MKLTLLIHTRLLLGLFLVCFLSQLHAQEVAKDSTHLQHVQPQYLDTTLRIINLNPYFTLHVDSVLDYDHAINRDAADYYWYLRNSPVGMRIDRATGRITFKAEKSLFKNGRLKFDQEYKVQLGVQNLHNPNEKLDTFFVLMFYSTEINPSRLKPSTQSTLTIEEGDTVRFGVQCEQGTFAIEQITMLTNVPIGNYRPVTRCGDEFVWMPPYDFVKPTDSAKQKTLVVQFVGADKFFNKDTAVIRVTVKEGTDYPMRNQEHKRVSEELSKYVQDLKLTFYVMSHSVKKTKGVRTGFDVSSSSTALAGTVISTTATDPDLQRFGKVLPSVGVTLVPVKEAVAPNKIQEQNTASQVRTVVKRLEYMVSENALLGDKDLEVLAKTKKMQDEMKQARMQLIDVPLVEFEGDVTAQEADKYFYDPKVNKKYKLKAK